jgi:replicative DNA helicase
MASTEKQTRRDERKHKPARPADRESSHEENDVWPCNVQIERELIGCLLIAGCEYALDTLQAKDFHDEFCAFLFTEIREARQQKVPVNSEGTLLHWLTGRGALAKAGAKYPRDTAWHLADMMSKGIVANVQHYCGVLRELRKKRAAKHVSLDLLRMSVKDEVTAEKWRSEVDSKLRDFDRL